MSPPPTCGQTDRVFEQWVLPVASQINQKQVKKLRINWNNPTKSVLYGFRITVRRQPEKGQIMKQTLILVVLNKWTDDSLLASKQHKPIKSLLDFILKVANWQYSFHWSAIPILVFAYVDLYEGVCGSAPSLLCAFLYVFMSFTEKRTFYKTVWINSIAL